MRNNRYLKRSEIKAVADDVLRAHGVCWLDHWGMVDCAKDRFRDRYGFIPVKSCILLAVKMTKAGWQGVIARTKAEIAESEWDGPSPGAMGPPGRGPGVLD